MNWIYRQNLAKAYLPSCRHWLHRPLQQPMQSQVAFHPAGCRSWQVRLGSRPGPRCRARCRKALSAGRLQTNESRKPPSASKSRSSPAVVVSRWQSSLLSVPHMVECGTLGSLQISSDTSPAGISQRHLVTSARSTIVCSTLRESLLNEQKQPAW